MNDLETLHELNRGYVRAAEASDVGWYDAHLAEDFLASNPDGSLVDRGGFLAHVKGPYPGSNLAPVDVSIRLFGEVALIHAGFRYTTPDGQPGTGRDTDVWARRDGRWRCVAAHFNRR